MDAPQCAFQRTSPVLPSRRIHQAPLIPIKETVASAGAIVGK